MMWKELTHAAFWIICGSLSVYMVVLQFLTYFDNADAPKITFRTFNESPDDVYPDITLCFIGAPNHRIYKGSYVQQQYSLNKSDYNKLLLGDSKTWEHVPNASSVANGNFENALIELKDLIIYYYAGLHDVISPLTRDQLMSRTYQIPGRVCFTRNLKTHLKKGDLITMESFRIRLTHVAVQIFIHYPGETLRKVFGMDRIYKAALTMTKQELDSSNRYEIKLSQMTVLKKRQDAVDPCDPNPSDDERFWEAVFERLSCLPSYWKTFAPTNTTLLECRTWNELEKMVNLTNANISQTQIREKESILSSITTPCNEMGLVVNSQMQTKKNPEDNDVLIKILYHMNKYQEIRNEKDFGFDSLWANIGGFLGIFIGYSLLNFLDDGYDLMAYLFKVNSSPGRLQSVLSIRNEPHGE